ncbi:MAG: lectin like domain-containing protein, partial [Armatimonadota bacterium]
NKDGFDPGPLDGGDYWMAAAYLARWSGPVSEADDPYQPNSAVSPANLPCRRHVQDVTYLPKRTSYTDNAVVKQFIMTRGALYCGMNWKDSYMNWATFAMYNPTTNLGAGHAVAVIGWNDAYAAANFPTPPPGPGAFLIRDSEGTSFLPEGCFWISYYDKSLCDFACFARTEALTNYSKQYSYDPLGWVNEGSITGGVRRPYFANIFRKGTTAESLRAVATHATAANTHYELKVYRNPTTSPVHGSPVATQTGAFTYAGFHTVVLSTPVTLAAADKSFSVVFRVTNPGTTYLIPLEYAYAGYSSKATAATGQSYYSSTGTTWTDATTWKKTCNVCVKAYTNPVLSASAPADPALSLAGLTATETAGGGGAVVFTLSAPAVVEARVLNLAGRTVRPLCEGSTCKRGTNTLLWDGRNQTGARTPSGTYLVEVQARSANGTTRRALTTMPVAAGQTR